MKKYLLLSIIAFTLYDYTWGQEYNCKDESSPVKCSHAFAKNHLIKYRENLATANYDILYHRLIFKVDPAVRYIDGQTISYFKMKESGYKISLDASISLSIDSVKYNSKNIGFVHDNDILTITFPKVIQSGEIDSVTVFYQGEPPSNGFGSFETSTHNGSPVLWTLSEPYGSRDWWPNKMSLTDKIDSVDIFIKVPEIYKAASNGLLVNSSSQNGQTTYHWKHRHPIASYLVAIAVTDYSIFSNYVPMPDGKQLEVLNYVYPESLEDAQNNTPKIIPIIQLYNDLTIPYPFANEKYGHAQFGWSGGMEHQTMSFMKNFGFGLMAHECAHQWFGDHVTCGSWEDIWLNEGFATYFEGICQQNLNPGNWNNWKTGKLNNITSNDGGSVKVDDTTSVSRIFSSRLTYNKGAYILHMLRWTLGDEVFFQAIRNYLTDVKLAGGFAKTPDLIAAFEDESGKNLSKFFDQWFYKQGFPSYSLLMNQEAGGKNKKLTIFQTQSHPSVDFFEMTVPVQFFRNGQDTILKFEHTYSGQIFDISIEGNIDSIKFDPDLWLISKNNTLSVNTNEIIFDHAEFDLYPNPGYNGFYISSYDEIMEKISVVDGLGRTILVKYPLKQGDYITTNYIIPGTYSIIIQTKTGLFSKKWIKN